MPKETTENLPSEDGGRTVVAVNLPNGLLYDIHGTAAVDSMSPNDLIRVAVQQYIGIRVKSPDFQTRRRAYIARADTGVSAVQQDPVVPGS